MSEDMSIPAQSSIDPPLSAKQAPLPAAWLITTLPFFDHSDDSTTCKRPLVKDSHWVMAHELESAPFSLSKISEFWVMGISASDMFTATCCRFVCAPAKTIASAA